MCCRCTGVVFVVRFFCCDILYVRRSHRELVFCIFDPCSQCPVWVFPCVFVSFLSCIPIPTLWYIPGTAVSRIFSLEGLFFLWPVFPRFRSVFACVKPSDLRLLSRVPIFIHLWCVFTDGGPCYHFPWIRVLRSVSAYGLLVRYHIIWYILLLLFGIYSVSSPCVFPLPYEYNNRCCTAVLLYIHTTIDLALLASHLSLMWKCGPIKVNAQPF